MKKKVISIITLSLLILTIVVQPTIDTAAYYSGYPVSNPTTTYLKNLSYDVYIWNSDNSNWSYMSLSGDQDLADNLKVYEFASYSSDASKLYSNKLCISTDFIDAWETLRAQTGSIFINSGYRNSVHNDYWVDRGKATKQSEHAAGSAADMSVPSGYSDITFKALCETSGFTGTVYIISSTSVHAGTWGANDYPFLNDVGHSALHVFTAEDALICHDYSPILSGYYSSSDISEMEDFQSANGLSPTGEVNDDTWDKLMAH